MNENDDTIVVIDAIKNFDCSDECILNWYICPKCNHKHIIFEDKYCRNCGIKFEWIGEYNYEFLNELPY